MRQVTLSLRMSVCLLLYRYRNSEDYEENLMLIAIKCEKWVNRGHNTEV